MSEAKTKGKPGRPSRTLDEEIAAAEERLRALKEKKREDERRALERNQKAIVYLLRTELLDEIPIGQWKAAVPTLRAVLTGTRSSDVISDSNLSNQFDQSGVTSRSAHDL